MKWKSPVSTFKRVLGHDSDESSDANATAKVAEEKGPATGGGSKKKNKKLDRSEKKTRSEQISPLMAAPTSTADDSQRSVTSSASSTRLTDDQRDKRKKERSDRKAKRNKDYEAKQEESTQIANKGKVKKLSLAEQDAKDSKLTCCHKFAQILAKFVHVTDFIIGLVFLGYGIFLLAHTADPVTEAAIGCCSFGGFHIATCIAGAHGFRHAGCRRIGLAISLYSGAILALGYTFVMVYSFGNHDPLFDYLTEHMAVMGMTEETIVILEKLLPFWYITLAALIAVELVRFVMLFRIRETLLRYDAVKKRQAAAGSERSLMTTPLVDEEAGRA